MRKGLISGLAFILVGVGLAAGGWSYVENYANDIKAARSRWPTVQGTVLASSVVGLGDPDIPTRLNVKFTYQVDGMRYYADQSGRAREDSLDILTGSSPRTKAAVRDYWPGRIVTVYYNPTNPSKAQVWPKADDWWLELGPFVLVAGFLLVVIGIGLLRPGNQQGSTSD